MNMASVSSRYQGYGGEISRSMKHTYDGRLLLEYSKRLCRHGNTPDAEVSSINMWFMYNCVVLPVMFEN